MSHKKVLVIAPNFYGLDNSIAQAFERNGLETIHVNYRMDLWESVLGKLTRLFHGTKKIVNPLLEMSLKKENQKYISIAKSFKPSFIIIIKGETLLPETIRYFKKELGIPCISYQWDDPFYSFPGATGGDDYRTHNFERGISDYERIFVFDKYYIEEIQNKGGQNVSYLPLAADDELFKRLTITENEQAMYGHDVCFVGMPFQNRIDILNALNGFNVGVFGDYWGRNRDKIDGNYFKGKASGETVRKIYCASKIVLNINHPQSKNGMNTRTFEIPSCEAFGIVDYISGIEELFNVGEEIVCYKNIVELKELITYYLGHPGERDAIAKKGYERVKQEHTWCHRMKKVIDTVA